MVAALFFQFYPLKAFNYVLPLIPALSMLAGRGVHEVAVGSIAGELRDRARQRTATRPLGARQAGCWRCWRLPDRLAIAVPVFDAAKSDSYFGLREAAKWLKANTSQMTA